MGFREISEHREAQPQLWQIKNLLRQYRYAKCEMGVKTWYVKLGRLSAN